MEGEEISDGLRPSRPTSRTDRTEAMRSEQFSSSKAFRSLGRGAGTRSLNDLLEAGSDVCLPAGKARGHRRTRVDGRIGSSEYAATVLKPHEPAS